MEWYQYVAAFFSGAFLCNAIPHFVNGISGNFFPTPFSKPPGRGLSSPTTNVLWGLLNIIIGCALFIWGGVHHNQAGPMVVFFIGAALLSIMMSNTFRKKAKEQ